MSKEKRILEQQLKNQMPTRAGKTVRMSEVVLVENVAKWGVDSLFKGIDHGTATAGLCHAGKWVHC